MGSGIGKPHHHLGSLEHLDGGLHPLVEERQGEQATTVELDGQVDPGLGDGHAPSLCVGGDTLLPGQVVADRVVRERIEGEPVDREPLDTGLGSLHECCLRGGLREAGNLVI